jgi:integrase
VRYCIKNEVSEHGDDIGLAVETNRRLDTTADILFRRRRFPFRNRCAIKRTPRADGFHAFRRAASKYLRKAGLELAAVQLGHKRMTTTDEHYNDRDMDDLKRAAELIEGPFFKDFALEG